MSDVEGPVTSSATAADFSKLTQGLARLPQPSFAVLDGGQWADLPKVLDGAGLSGRSLFLGAGSAEEAAGPWLVAISQRPGASSAIMKLLADMPAAVFWGCPAGEAALWRHLRTLTQIEIPRADPAGADPGEADALPETLMPAAGSRTQFPAHRSGSEVVWFRYWDPRSMGSLLPLLDEAQFARVLGPAAELLFHDVRAHGGIGVRRVLRSDDLPPAPRGRLRLSNEQVAMLDAAAEDRSHRRVGSYLRHAAPEETGQLNDEALDRFVREAHAEGTLAGLEGQRAHGQWAYLSLTTGGAVNRDGKVLGYVMRGGGVPDTNLDRLFERMTGLAQAEAAGKGSA